jgi:hypothetical protein
MKRRTFLLANLAGAACAALGIKPAKAKRLPKTDIIIYANGRKIGVMKNLSISETHNQPVEYSTERIRFDALRIKEAFDRGAACAATQKRPIEIRVTEDGVTRIKSPPLWMVHDEDGPLNFVSSGFVVASTHGPCSADLWMKRPIMFREAK